jgi:4-amino-4-deoxy-L-arabinose transferase-like glycosyltransferase
MPSSTSGQGYSLRWRYALVIFLVALSLRGLFLSEASRKPDFNLFYMDEEYNLEWAKSLATGTWHPPYDQLQHAPYFRAPLYSFLLAVLIKLVGPNMLAIRVVQMILGSASCALAYGVAAKCFGERVGVVTGLVCALYWVLAYFDSQLLQPVLLIFLLLAGLLLAFVAAERRSGRLAGASGLSFGLYAVTRPEILVFFPFAVWWAAKTARGASGRSARWFAVLLACGFLLPPALATVRNRVVSGDWVIVASQGGVNFYIGNNAESNGMQAVVPGTHESWWGGFEDTRSIASGAAGHSLKASEISAYWFRRSFEFMRQEPAAWLRLTLRKAFLFVGNVEIPNNEPYEARRGTYFALKAIPLGFGLLFGLFAVALPRMLGFGRRKRGADTGAGAVTGGQGPAVSAAEMRHSFVALILQFMLLYALTTIAFFVNGRYRVPLVPLVAMGAAVTVVAVWDSVRARHLASAVAMVAVAGAIAGVLSVDYFGVRKATGGFTAYTDALDLLESGKVDAAIVRLEAIRKQQSVIAPEFYLSLARAYVRRSGPEDSQAILSVAEEGLSHYPNEAELLWYAALGHFVEKQWDLARDRIERFLVLKPGDVRALHLAFSIAVAEGRTADARGIFARAQAVDPANPLVEDMRSSLASPSTP